MSSKLEWARSREREGLHISERRGLSCRNQSNLLKWLVLYARQFETARSYCLMEQKPKKRSVTQMAGSKSSVLKRNKRKDGAERKAEIQRRPWKTKSKAQNRNEQLQFQSLANDPPSTGARHLKIFQHIENHPTREHVIIELHQFFMQNTDTYSRGGSSGRWTLRNAFLFWPKIVCVKVSQHIPCTALQVSSK